MKENKHRTISLGPRRDKRTTISLARVVWEIAEEMMELKGFNGNISAYIADLIRRDKERTYPASTRQHDLLNEPRRIKS